MVCVAPKGAEECPTGTHEAGGHCLPTLGGCELCGGDEQCNGRDDDCNGQLDDGVCENGARCFVDGDPCPSGQVCAAYHCTPTCTEDADCGEGMQCKEVKDPYGGHTGKLGCVQSQASVCEVGCSVVASSTDDATLFDFVACMQDGQAACGAAMGCAQKLPINF
jgi:hypothetical protein